MVRYHLLVVVCLSTWVWQVRAPGADTPSYDRCSPAQMIQLKSQLGQLFTGGDARYSIGQHVFKRFLTRYPAASVYFTHLGPVHGPKFQAHAARVLSGMNVNLNLLDDPATLHAQEQHLRERHQALKVPDEYIRGLIRALNEEMITVIGRCFDRDLWKVCARDFFRGLMTGIPLAEVQTVPRPG